MQEYFIKATIEKKIRGLHMVSKLYSLSIYFFNTPQILRTRLLKYKEYSFILRCHKYYILCISFQAAQKTIFHLPQIS